MCSLLFLFTHTNLESVNAGYTINLCMLYFRIHSANNINEKMCRLDTDAPTCTLSKMPFLYKLNQGP